MLLGSTDERLDTIEIPNLSCFLELAGGSLASSIAAYNCEGYCSLCRCEGTCMSSDDVIPRLSDSSKFLSCNVATPGRKRI